MSEFDVSVIVLGWNGKEYVDACLSSLLDQDFERPYEVIFVDNGSRDGTPEIAERYGAVRVHRLDRNYGYCIGNNIGYGLARGAYVVFLNQDTVAHRAWLRELVAAVESDPAVAAAHANVIQPWYPEFAGMDRERPAQGAHTADLSRLGYAHYRRIDPAAGTVDTLFLHGVSIIARRSLIEELGYAFDPDMFAYAEDMDLGLRARSRGYRIVAATHAVVYHKHTLEARPSLATLRKTVRIIRNRLLALWKCSTWPAFAPLAAATLVGSPFNAGEFGLSRGKRIAYFFLLIPPTLLAAAACAVSMPRYATRRRQELEARRLSSWWLVRAMILHPPR